MPNYDLKRANVNERASTGDLFGLQVHSAAFAKELAPKLAGSSYQFMTVAAWQELVLRDIPKGMRVYWREILLRCHWASAASLIRTSRWLDA